MIDIIRRERFMAILRNMPMDKFEKTVQALFEGGIRIFEVTYNPSKSDTIETVNKSFEIIKANFGQEAYLCAGTVVKTEFVTAAHKAGAKCIVSPNTDGKIITLTKQLGMTSIPGAFTPTEICNAYELGADLVKIFPILPDNIGYLKNVISPLSHIPFVTTGGVRIDNAREFLEVGATAVAAGVTLVPNEMLSNDDYAGITENARNFLLSLY